MSHKHTVTMVLLAALTMTAAMAAPAGVGANRSVADAGGLRVPVNHKLPSAQQVLPLSLEVTRDMQLADLKGDPSAAAALQKALRDMSSRPTPAPPAGSPWMAGIVVSPLSPLHAVGAAWEQANVYMESHNSFFDPWHPVPTPGHDYITMISLNNPSRFFFDLMFRWPKSGYYMVSVNALSEFPTAARPRFGPAFTPNAPLTTMSPNDPAKPTRWTVLVSVPAAEVTQGMAGYGFFPSNPANVKCFIQAYIGRVTIRTL